MTRERVEAVLQRVRPFLQADGGDIELVEIDGHSAGVRLSGGEASPAAPVNCSATGDAACCAAVFCSTMSSPGTI